MPKEETRTPSKILMFHDPGIAATTASPRELVSFVHGIAGASHHLSV